MNKSVIQDWLNQIIKSYDNDGYNQELKHFKIF